MKVNVRLLYDPAGNLTLVDNAPDLRHFFSWDGNNTLRTIQEFTCRYEFTYDGLNRKIRAKKYAMPANTLAADTLYVYDGWNCVAEIDATANSVTKTYSWGLDLSGTLDGAGGVGGLLSVTDPNVNPAMYPNFRLHYCYDGNGNVVNLVNAGDGAVAAHYEYDPFGRTVLKDDAGAPWNEYRFSTKRLVDAAGGLYDYGYRHYSPDLGRWLSRDRVNEPRISSDLLDGSVHAAYADDLPNVYVYVDNSPLIYIDALGLQTTAPVSCGNICGKDVTESLRLTQLKVQSLYRALTTKAAKDYNCDPWRKPILKLTIEESIRAATRWDITGMVNDWAPKLGDGSTCGVGGDCQETVEVNNACYYDWDVNYVLYGWLNKLCGISQREMVRRIVLWKNFRTYTLTNGGSPTAAQAFAVAGLSGWPASGSPPKVTSRGTGRWSSCKSSGLKYIDTFTTSWPSAGGVPPSERRCRAECRDGVSQ